MKPEHKTAFATHSQVQTPALPCHDAEILTEGGRKAIIHLNDQTYTLQITRQGKLLLTK